MKTTFTYKTAFASILAILSVTVLAILSVTLSGSVDSTPLSQPTAAVEPGQGPVVTPELKRELEALERFQRAMEAGTADEDLDDRSAYARSLPGATTPPKWAKRLAWKRTRAQGVMLARMGVSEATRAIWPVGKCVTRPGVDGVPAERCGTGGALTSDIKHMAHVVINNRGSRKSFRDWLDVMGFLSPHVAGGRQLSKKRQAWTATLPAVGDGPPKGWRDCYASKARPCDGDWRIYAKTWPVYRQAVIRMWMGWTMPAIAGEPIAWGNARDVAGAGKRRGLELIPCPGCANGFMQRPPRTISVAVMKRDLRKMRRQTRAGERRPGEP